MARLTLPVPVALALATLVAACGGSGAPGPAPFEAGARDRALTAYGNLPLTFVEDRGRFVSQGAGHAFALTREGVGLSLTQPSGDGVNLALRFLGAAGVAPAGDRRAPGTVNYVQGTDRSRWRTNVPTYEGVAYRELWPGVDMALRGSGGELKYEFRVRPGAQVSDIRLGYEGTQGLRRDGFGGLTIDTALGELHDSPPVAYQEVAGVRVPIASQFVLRGKQGYGFAVGAYDPSRELVIDPAIAYSTLLGGSAHEVPAAIAVDAAGNAYVTGFTQSPNFPTTSGAFDRTGSASNNLDVFVSKLNSTGTALVYSTFIGGGSPDVGRAITIDSTGAAYVTGQTGSNTFPTTSGAFDRAFNVDSCPRCLIDQQDAFVLKLNPAGSSLVYSTFLGGTQFDDSLGIAIDGARNAYVVGQTGNSNFPLTVGAFDRTPAGAFDAFVTKLNSAGSALVYSTLLGGEDNELPSDIRVDAAGNALVGGSTRSTGFPTTPGAFDTTQNGGAFDERFDLFVTKFNASGSGLVYSTFVGGSKSDFGSGFTTDAAGNTYMVGSTLSPDFPTTAGAFDRVFDGGEGFALKLNASGSNLSYSTFLGAAFASAVAVDAGGNAWLAGGSGPGGPTTPDAFDPFFNGGGGDAYLAKLNVTGSAIVFASFLGGSESEGASDVALNPSETSVYLTGSTMSPDFPTTAGAFDRTWAGDPLIFWADGWVAKVDIGTTAPPVDPPEPAPAAPALTSPADAAVVASPVTFDWGDVSGATSYEIQVDEISEFGAPLIASANVAVSGWTTASLPDGNWFWRVRGINSEGTRGDWSATRRITVQTAPTPTPEPVPGTPTLLSPANGAAVSQPFTFDWSDVPNAAWYVIEADDSSSFAAPLVWAATTTPSQLATNSLPNGTSFWRVRAFNSDGVGGPVSAVRTVVVGAVATPTPPPSGGTLPAPSLLSPSSDARFSPGATITFRWGTVTGAATYTLQIDDSSSFSAPQTLNQTVSATSFATSTLPTRRMWWRVRANDSSSTPGTWSSARRFEVKN